MKIRFRIVLPILAAPVALAGTWLALRRPARVVCPAGSETDPARQAGIVERLRVGLHQLSALGDAQLLARTAAQRDGDTWCFGATSELHEKGPLVLDRTLDENEAAARAGHLLMHRVIPPWPEEDAPCEHRVRRALVAEARALSLELELRRALGVEKPKVVYAFAEEHDRAPPGQRGPFIQRVLRDHPTGAPGIPDLAGAYAERCRNQGTPNK